MTVTTAFVSGFGPSTSALMGSRASAFSGSTAMCRSSIAAARPRTATPTVTMIKRNSPVLESELDIKMPPKYNRVARDREAMQDAIVEQPKGFTKYAELVNGRVAMIFFIVGLITEIFSKDHLTMTDQLLLLFSPLTNLITSLAHLL